MGDSYRRRYFPGLEAATIMIQDNAVTRSKISAGAISSEQIEDGTIGADDIAANAVTTVKIAAAAVTAAKIATGVIDTTKLTFVPLTRPLTTPLATAEIADGAVTAPKLAVGAITGATLAERSVPASKIVADSLTSDEIASGAIGQTELEADSVGEDELQDNSVALEHMQDLSVGSDEIIPDSVRGAELAPLAVATEHIEDDAVETEKLDAAALEVRHIFSLHSRYGWFIDHFMGAVLDNRWAESGEAGGFTTIGSSYVFIATDGDINDKYRIDWNGARAFRIVDDHPHMIFRATLDYTSVKVFMGFYVDATNFVGFRLDSAVDANIKAVTSKAGAETETDTGITVSAPSHWYKFHIEVTNDTTVKFFIDDALVATHTTNLPTGLLEPRFNVETLAASQKRITIDYVAIKHNPKQDITP